MPNDRISLLIGPISLAAVGTLYQQIVDRLKRESAKAGSNPARRCPRFARSQKICW